MLEVWFGYTPPTFPASQFISPLLRDDRVYLPWLGVPAGRLARAGRGRARHDDVPAACSYCSLLPYTGRRTSPAPRLLLTDAGPVKPAIQNIYPIRWSTRAAQIKSDPQRFPCCIAAPPTAEDEYSRRTLPCLQGVGVGQLVAPDVVHTMRPCMAGTSGVRPVMNSATSASRRSRTDSRPRKFG
jgi:hypothetical protein